MRPGFEAMRARLRRRGLLDDAHQLTDEGRAYCDRLLERLPDRRVRARPDSRPLVKWSRAGDRVKG